LKYPAFQEACQASAEPVFCDTNPVFHWLHVVADFHQAQFVKQLEQIFVTPSVSTFGKNLLGHVRTHLTLLASILHL
jgi:hypothetical protein